MDLVTTHSVPARAVSIDNDTLDTLRSRISGEIITPGSPLYDRARKSPFLAVDRRPQAIVRPVSDTDVASAVNFARNHSLPLAVQSGGHSIAGNSMIDDAVVIDFASMKRVMIDPASGTARVQPGATSADLAGPAAEHGLALSTGDTPTVGMGGLTTGGGIGFMVRKHGLAIDSLLSARVVTAAGQIVTASEQSHPDLFWAIRGGGGNFGIVTDFTFQLAPVGEILGGALILPATREVLRGYIDYSIEAPEDLTTIANVIPASVLSALPPELDGTLVLLVLVAWTGSIEEGQKAMAPLRALAEPIADLVNPIPYPAIYTFTSPDEDAQRKAAVRMMFADQLSDDMIDTSLAAMRDTPPGETLFQIRGLGGAMARVAPDATAFAHRERRYFVAVIKVWDDPTEDPTPHEEWTQSLWDAIRYEGFGVYVNFLQREGDDRIREAYPGETYERLASIKAMYDPDNLFRFNQNIPPRR